MNASDWLKHSVRLFTLKAAPIIAAAAKPSTNTGAGTAPSLPRPSAARLLAKTKLKHEAHKPSDLRALLTQLQAIIDPKLSETEGGRKASEVAAWYSTAKATERVDCWQLMSEQFGLNLAQMQASMTHTEQITGEAEWRLRRSLRCPRTELIQRFSAFPEGMRFLLDLRSDLMAFLRKTPAYRPALLALDAELEALFATWFDVAFLELRKISWDSPASLIEKLITYEAVHHIQSWADLKNRLDNDRRCYGFFHPRLPQEPLIFVEVAFTTELAHAMAPILDDTAAALDLQKIRVANFYSISNTQTGLKGVGFGDSLIKQVVQALQLDLPQLKVFTTLSPIPGFRDWLTAQAEPLWRATPEKLRQRMVRAGVAGTHSAGATPDELLKVMASQTQPLAADHVVAQWLMQAAAHYLTHLEPGQTPKDPVARFHIGNGATVARLNWAADLSANGQRQSFGLMVNYLYDLKRLDKNRKQLSLGKIACASSLITPSFDFSKAS